MPEADTAAADEDVAHAPDEAADHGAADAIETHGDQPAARPTESADKAKPAGDDAEVEDPLLLAQQDPPAPKPEPAAAKPATTTAAKPDQRAAAKPLEAPATKPDAAKPKPTTTKPEAGAVDEDEQLATTDLPPEDWGKLSHKAKSQFLAQRKVIRARDEATKQVKELARFRDDYQSVEKFVRDQGLENQEYQNSLIVAGAIKRGDARILPFLEETVARVRKAAGLADPTPAAPADPIPPAVDADELAKLLDEAETSFDFAKLRALQAKLKAPATTPAAPAKPAAAPAKPAAAAPAAAPAQPAAGATAPDPAEVAESNAILDALVALGIPQGEVVDYAKGIISEITENGAKAPPPVGQRMRALMTAHKAKASAAAPAPRPLSAPLSGRRGPVRAPRSEPTNVDPLNPKHAFGG